MITSSSVPGIGAKAIKPGRVIGMALEPLTVLGTQKYKSILTYINPHWWENSPFIDEEIDELRAGSRGWKKRCIKRMNTLFKNILFLFLCACSSAALGAGINFNDTTNKAAPVNNPSFTGDVGIGTLSPGQALDVQGTVRMKFLAVSGQAPVSGDILSAIDSAGDIAWK